MGVVKDEKWLAKLLSIEFLSATGIVVFTAGVMWTNLNNAIADNADELVASKKTDAVLQKSVNDLQVTTNVIISKQDNTARVLDHLADEMKTIKEESAKDRRQQQEDIKQILRILGGNGG